MKRCLLLAVSAQLILCVPALAAEKKAAKRLVPPPPPNSAIITKPQQPPSVVPSISTSFSNNINDSSKSIVVGSGGPYVLNGSNNQRFADLFNFVSDDGKEPLTMTIDAGAVPTNRPNIRWIRVYLGNRLLATEKDFRGKGSLKLDLTGTVDPGTQQIIIQGAGARGETIKWSASSVIRVRLDKVNPDEACPGETISLRGENFSMTPDKNKVTVGKSDTPVISATSNELKVKIPTRNPEIGEVPVVVTVDGLRTKPVKITVRGIPELTGTNFDGIPPGAELCIFGKNFSKKLQENQVFFEGTPAEVVRGTTEELVVIVPNFYMGGGSASLSGQVAIPIRVKVGKVESKNTVPITVGNSMWQSPGFRGGPETPIVPVGF